MLRTILSENQYDPKFIATAKKNPKIRPWPPPSISPRNMTSALSAPSSSAVLTTLLIYLLYSLNQSRDECRAVRQRLDIDVLVQRMGAVADRAESVKCWDADRGREVAVRATASAALRQIVLPELACDRSCLTIKRSEEHTSELQSRPHLVCRLLLDKKKP